MPLNFARSIRLSLLGTLALSPRLSSQVVVQDSAAHGHRFIPPLEAAGFAVLLAGAFVADQSLRDYAQQHRSRDPLIGIGNSNGDPLYVAPPIGLLWVVGKLAHKPKWSTAAWHTIEATALAGGADQILKLVSGRSRPGEDIRPGSFHPFSGNVSFPSGHVTVAFAVASTLAKETGDKWWIDVLLYGFAANTARARINDDRHWLSDVVVGAALGHLGARFIERSRGTKIGKTKIVLGPTSVGLSIGF